MRAGLFVLLSLVVALASGVVTFLTPTTLEAMKCNQTSSIGVYLAYCENQKFADYEHAAYYLKFEPEAVANVERADVLILGSSLAQMSFSTDATASYFRSRKLRYHLMGFGYNEGGRFGLGVLSKMKPHAKLYIIHAFGFFSDFLSKPAEEAIQDRSDANFYRKKYGAKVARSICALIPSACGSKGSIYRRWDTGAWDWTKTLGSGRPRTIPSNVKIGPPPTPDDLARAEKMAAALGVPGECIVITMTPNVDNDLSDQTRRIAEHIHAVALIPHLSGLTTIDGYHLEKASDERWSSTFFASLDEAASRCAAFHAKEGPVSASYVAK